MCKYIWSLAALCGLVIVLVVRAQQHLYQGRREIAPVLNVQANVEVVSGKLLLKRSFHDNSRDPWVSLSPDGNLLAVAVESLVECDVKVCRKISFQVFEAMSGKRKGISEWKSASDDVHIAATGFVSPTRFLVITSDGRCASWDVFTKQTRISQVSDPRERFFAVRHHGKSVVTVSHDDLDKSWTTRVYEDGLLSSEIESEHLSLVDGMRRYKSRQSNSFAWEKTTDFYSERGPIDWMCQSDSTCLIPRHIDSLSETRVAHPKKALTLRLVRSAPRDAAWSTSVWAVSTNGQRCWYFARQRCDWAIHPDVRWWRLFHRRDSFGFSPDGRYIAEAGVGTNFDAVVVDVLTGRTVWRRYGHVGPMNPLDNPESASVSVCWGGRNLLAIGSEDGSVEIWQIVLP